MNTLRFPFVVQQVGDELAISMDCGGVIRCRTMPMEFAETLVVAMSQVQEAIETLLHDEEWKAKVPDYPKCREAAEGNVGPCDVRVVASKADDVIEFTTALYDEGDREAPVLVLVNEQLEEFVEVLGDVS